MGSNDVPPSHVPSFYLPVANLLMGVSGALWTTTYILMLRCSFKHHTYGMPMFSLALNFAWEIVYALYVAESPLEQIVFGIWMVLDIGLVYTVIAYGRSEWRQASFVSENLGKIMAGLVLWCCIAHWSFAKWWLDHDINLKPGKFYRGREGPDTTELGWWSALVNQVILSTSGLAQLVVRGHSGGVGWGIWATRTLGSFLGMPVLWAWAYWYWPEAHAYFLNPFAISLGATSLICDLVYPLVLRNVSRKESQGEYGGANGKRE